MNHIELRARLLEYVDGSLPAAAMTELSAHLEECAECRDVYNQYRAICRLEKAAAAKKPQLTEDLSQAVMAATAELTPANADQRTVRRLKWTIGGLTTLNLFIAALVVIVLQRPYAPQHSERSPIASTAGGFTLASARMESSPVFEPVTVELPTLEGVEHIFSPHAMISVKCRYEAKDGPKDVVIAPLVKAHRLNVTNLPGGKNRTEAKASLTLLASPEDVRRIEFARLMGEIALVILVPQNEAEANDPATVLKDPNGREVSNEVTPGTVGVMHLYDPLTRKQNRWVFSNGNWQKESGVELTAF